MMAAAIGADHHEIRFRDADIFDRFARMIYHAECPVKETYNTCVLALSQATHAAGIKVILGGEGADELFAGYPGYRFDAFRAQSGAAGIASPEEARCRDILWGDASVGYERNYAAFARARRGLYSPALRDQMDREGALSARLADPARLAGRHVLHQRSYLDCKLRLSDHLLSDHGDRMLMANSVEGRYPFLDRELVGFARAIPPDLKLNGLDEKYILKKIAAKMLPKPILQREKFGFHAASSPVFLDSGQQWVEDFLSYDLIKRQGYFCADAVEQLKANYRKPGFRLDPRHEDDLLLIVLSFNVMLATFFG
jgi:asparagine synthase (glutamine-hydrolysing)